MTAVAERPAFEPPLFDEVRYNRLLAAGEAAAASRGNISWQHMQELEHDAEFETVMRASFATEHAETTAGMVTRLLSSDEGRLASSYGMRVCYGDRGAALTSATDHHGDSPAADALTDLLSETYRREGSSPPHLVPHLRRHVPARVMRACEQYDSQNQSIPADEAKRLASMLHQLGAGLSKKDDSRQQLARELFDINATQPRRGAMDAVMRSLLVEGTLFSEALYGLFKIDDPLPLKKLWESGYNQDLLPNDQPDPNSITHQEYIELNAQRVLDIERQRPGGVRLLARRFDIRNIGRIPEDWLLDLIDMDHSKFSRLILAGMTSSCDNGAIMQGTEHINKVRKSLPGGMTIIPVELSSPSQLQERLEFLERARRIFGGKAKIVGAILNGHGMSSGHGDKIELSIIYGGRGSAAEHLVEQDVAGAIGALLDRLLEVDAPTLVISCGMAKRKDGLCAKLFQRLNRQVTGMRESAGLAGLAGLAIKQRRGTSAIRFVASFTHRTAASPTRWTAQRSRAKHFRPQAAAPAPDN
jgi:hypothetical protein